MTHERCGVGVRSRHCLAGRVTATTPPPKPAAPRLHRTDDAAGNEPPQRRACPTPAAPHRQPGRPRRRAKLGKPDVRRGRRMKPIEEPISDLGAWVIIRHSNTNEMLDS
jgi:hypothetical protein